MTTFLQDSSNMGRRGALTEHLVRDVSTLQHKLRLKEMEAEALSQRCRDLEADRDSLKAAYDLTRACQAALMNDMSGQTGCRMRPASYYVPTSCQTLKPPATRIQGTQPSFVDWQSELLRGLDENAVKDNLEHHSGEFGDPPQTCRIQ
jgi:hypothetical protein